MANPRVGFYAHTDKLYLYDGGVLLATFDGYDNVTDLYVNGPTGRLATYYQNNTNQHAWQEPPRGSGLRDCET